VRSVIWLLIVCLMGIFIIGCVAPQGRGSASYSTVTYRCGFCGKEIPPNSRECPFCHKPLATAATSSPTPSVSSSPQQPPAQPTPSRTYGRIGEEFVPKVKLGGLLCIGERDAQRFPDVFVALELVRVPVYSDDPLSPALTADIGVAYELLFVSLGMIHLVEGWENFGGFFFIGLDWKRRYGADEADFAIGFGIYFGGF